MQPIHEDEMPTARDRRDLPTLARAVSLPMTAYLQRLERRALQLDEVRREDLLALVDEVRKARNALIHVPTVPSVLRAIQTALDRFTAARVDVVGLEDYHGREAVCEAAGISASHYASCKGAHEGKAWKTEHLAAFMDLDSRFSADLEIVRWRGRVAAREAKQART